jgi:hypothetical protein
MTSDFYFFDQYSHASRIGGVHRCKRDSKDFNQALFHVKIVLSTDDNDHSNNHTKNQTDDILLQKISHQLEKPMLPEILTKELDKILQIFNDKSRPTSSASSRSKSPEQDIQNKEESTNPTSNQPKVSLPDSLIIQLHSTWLDLIKNTDYKYKVKLDFLMKYKNLFYKKKRFGVQKLVKNLGVNMFKKNVQDN